MAEVIELILTDERKGKGTDGDPVRNVMQLWTKTGVLVAEKDGDDSWWNGLVEE